LKFTLLASPSIPDIPIVIEQVGENKTDMIFRAYPDPNASKSLTVAQTAELSDLEFKTYDSTKKSYETVRSADLTKESWLAFTAKKEDGYKVHLGDTSTEITVTYENVAEWGTRAVIDYGYGDVIFYLNRSLIKTMNSTISGHDMLRYSWMYANSAYQLRSDETTNHDNMVRQGLESNFIAKYNATGVSGDPVYYVIYNHSILMEMPNDVYTDNKWRLDIPQNMDKCDMSEAQTWTDYIYTGDDVISTPEWYFKNSTMDEAVLIVIANINTSVFNKTDQSGIEGDARRVNFNRGTVTVTQMERVYHTNVYNETGIDLHQDGYRKLTQPVTEPLTYTISVGHDWSHPETREPLMAWGSTNITIENISCYGNTSIARKMYFDLGNYSDTIGIIWDSDVFSAEIASGASVWTYTDVPADVGLFVTNTSGVASIMITIEPPSVGSGKTLSIINETISSGETNSAPTFDQNIPDSTIEYGNSYEQVVNITDDYNISDTININDTTNFEISINGSANDKYRAVTVTNKVSLSIQTYYLNLTVQDEPGLKSSQVFTVTVEDTTAPAWTTPPSNQSIEYGNPVDFTVLATDLQTVSYFTNATYFQIGSSDGRFQNISWVDVGNYSVMVNATDPSENELRAEFVVDIHDTTAPTLNETLENQTYSVNSEFRYDLNASDLSVPLVWRINDTTNFNITTEGLITNNTGLGALNSYSILFNVTDPYNNFYSGVLVVTNESSFTAPSFDQTPTDQTTEYGGAFSYRVNVTDDYNISTITVNDTTNFKITVNGSANDKYRSGLIENNTYLSLTSYSLNISASDEPGRVTSHIITITVQDTTPPTWDQTPTDQNNEFGEYFSYQVNASDLLLDAYGINDTTNFNLTGGLITSAYIGSTTDSYSLNITANDTSGNTISVVISINPVTPLTWDQPTGDWNSQDMNRFGSLSLEANATGNAAIEYSTNSSEITINAATGVFSWVPDGDFVGTKSVTVYATNDSGTTEISNIVTIDVNYVDYYGSPGNISNIGELIEYENAETGNFLVLMILIALYVIIFVALKNFPTEHAFSVASIITGLVSVYFYIGGWVDIWYVEVFVVLMAIGVILLVWRR